MLTLLFLNTLYTTPINFQWGLVAIISLKSSGLKASKGRREIRDTNPFSLFQSPSFCEIYENGLTGLFMTDVYKSDSKLGS